jgi:hypothetical protein
MLNTEKRRLLMEMTDTLAGLLSEKDFCDICKIFYAAINRELEEREKERTK